MTDKNTSIAQHEHDQVTIIDNLGDAYEEIYGHQCKDEVSATDAEDIVDSMSTMVASIFPAEIQALNDAGFTEQADVLANLHNYNNARDFILEVTNQI